jgi:hypothetical protein
MSQHLRLLVWLELQAHTIHTIALYRYPVYLGLPRVWSRIKPAALG